MNRALALTCCLWLAAGCDKPAGPPQAAAGGPALDSAPLPTYASYEAYCAALPNANCLGAWEGHPAGTAALGAYRFVLVEYPKQKDGQGPVTEVLFELKTPRGVAYRSIGRNRSGQVANSVIVKEVVDLPDAIELRSVFRTAPRLTYTDFYSSTFFITGPSGPAAVELALGQIVGDVDTGKTTGHVGEAKWLGGKLSVKGATVPDGEWLVAAH